MGASFIQIPGKQVMEAILRTMNKERSKKNRLSLVSHSLTAETRSSRPVVPGGLMFTADVFFFQREMSELPRPIAVKLMCDMIES